MWSIRFIHHYALTLCHLRDGVWECVDRRSIALGKAVSMIISWIIPFIILLSSLVATGFVWVVCSRQISAQRERAIRAETTLASERTAHEAQLATLRDGDQRLQDAFARLSSDALQRTTDQLMQLAHERLERQQQVARSDLDSLISPLRTALAHQQQHITQLESARERAYGGIEEQLKRMSADQLKLQHETANLIKALRQPQVRGRWGELQLRQVVELAGMSSYCDFYEQQTVTTEDGNRQRPDMQVRLPNQRQIVVDSKVPLAAYLQALEASDDDTRTAHLQDHARQVRSHVTDMSRRAYHKQIDGAHDFLVLFIPGEVFYRAALEHDSELLEYAFSKGIILATPTTLIAVLKAVALGWRETRMTQEAQQIKEAGEKVYKALTTLASYMSTLGRGLEQTTTAYNKAIGNMEVSVLAAARQLHELDVSSEPIVPPKLLNETLRTFSKVELASGD